MSNTVNASRQTPLRLSRLGFLWKRRHPLSFLAQLHQRSADVVWVHVGSRVLVLLNHPSLVQQLLLTDAALTEKGRTVERELFFAFLGDGLLNVQGDEHRRQRRLVLPAFHRSRLKAYSQAMVDASSSAARTWRDGDERDVNAEMMALTLAVVGRTLFASEVGGASKAITDGFDELTANVNRMVFPGARWLLQTPLPFARRLQNSQRNLDAAVYALIRERRTQGADMGDLLSMLLMAEDAEQPGERLSDVEVRDQVMTLLFTGQGPIGNTLSWTWWLLAQHPEYESQLHAELARVLGGREPTFEDLPNLVVTERIVREVLRLYPSIWTMGRRAKNELKYAGQTIPRGALLLATQWTLQRDARWFPEPEAFHPNRWTPEFRAALPRFAYFPFGGGGRSCIGENFAWTELVLIVATIAQRWRFTATADTPLVRPHARITLHPDRPVLLKLQQRGGN